MCRFDCLNSGFRAKMYSWLLVLVFLMARGGPGAKRRRSSAEQQEEQAAERSGSEYNPGDDSDDDSQGEDWEMFQATLWNERVEQDKEDRKGKGKEKMKAKTMKSHKTSGGVKFRDAVISSSSSESLIPTSSEESTDWERRSLYSSKVCIVERFVDIRQIFPHVPQLNGLLRNGDLHEACNFCEKTGYCLELVQEFYMRGGKVENEDCGPFSFMTRVRGIDCKVTPDVIGTVLGIESEIVGNDYLTSGFDSVRDWSTVMKALTLPNTLSKGLVVKSKELKIEYRFLNLILGYNVMPVRNTKLVPWDRMLYMYLLANPELVNQRFINLNVPFLIWRRMVRDIQSLGVTKRLSFPLLIMRLLDLFGVNTDCSFHEYGKGPVNASTFAKALGEHSSDIHPTGDPMDIHSEVIRLSAEVVELRKMVKAIFEKLGCVMPPPGSDSE